MVPLVLAYYPALNALWTIIRKHYPIIENSEAHRNVFPQPPIIAVRKCKNLKYMLVRSKVYSGGNKDNSSGGCVRCDGKRCQVFFFSIDAKLNTQLVYTFDCAHHSGKRIKVIVFPL